MRCPIEELPNLPKLTKLNAIESSLIRIPDILYRLETIMVDNTKLSNIPETLISAITISANNTDIADISSKLINVESLSVANTLVTNINIMMSLQYLNCSNTRVDSILVDQMPTLRKIYARGCTFADPFSIIKQGIDLFT